MYCIFGSESHLNALKYITGVTVQWLTVKQGRKRYFSFGKYKKGDKTERILIGSSYELCQKVTEKESLGSYFTRPSIQDIILKLYKKKGTMFCNMYLIGFENPKMPKSFLDSVSRTLLSKWRCSTPARASIRPLPPSRWFQRYPPSPPTRPILLTPLVFSIIYSFKRIGCFYPFVCWTWCKKGIIFFGWFVF